jgi:hypothetical protein
MAISSKDTRFADEGWTRIHFVSGTDLVVHQRLRDVAAPLLPPVNPA